MEEKLNRLLRWARGEKIGPLSIEMWPTNRCNLKCIMCGTWASRRRVEERGLIYNPEDEQKRELSDEIWLKVIEDAVELKTREFLITGGGEPLVRKETTLKLMEKIKEAGAFGIINTNGVLFSSSDILSVISIGWDVILFSIDGADRKTHDSIRNVSGTFQKVKRNLLELKKQKKRLRVEKPKIAFNTVILNKNFRKIPKILKFAASVGCEDITFIPLITFDKSIERYKLSLDEEAEFKKLLPKIETLAQQLNIHTNIHELRERNFQRMDEAIKNELERVPHRFALAPCYEPFLHLLITPDGEVTCCCMLAGKGIIKVDFSTTQLSEVWFGEWFGKLRRQFLEQKLPPNCSNCVFSQYVRNAQIRNELQKILS